MSSMNPDLHVTEPDATVDPTPFAPIAGDWHDDDGEALSEQFQAAWNPPVKSEGVQYAKETLPETNRTIHNRLTFPSDSPSLSPVRALTADPRRTLVLMWIAGVTNELTNGFFFSGEDFSISDDYPGGPPTGMIPNASWVSASVGSPFTLPGYTGPVYVCGAGGTAITVEILAVTK